ncbi:MAG TPA: hypothetical protein VGD52_03140 [Pseudoduganella sp.]
MNARTILAVLSAVFLAAAIWRLLRDGGRVAPSSKTWLLAGGIFALVSAWLWLG